MPLQTLTGDLTFKSMKPCDLSNCTKGEIAAYFINSYDLNDSLFTCLRDESAILKCPDRLRLPLIFYYAHTAVVYVNKLVLAGLLKDRVNLEFESLFETGVDEMSWDDTENYRMGGKYKWPSLDKVVEYRRTVRGLILKLIEDTPLTLPVTMESPWWALFMGMEHERIHVETSSVLIRQLPIEMVKRPSKWLYGPLSSGAPVHKNPIVEVDACAVTLGKPTDFPSYGWDNEYGQLECSVPSFKASKYLVTNRQFLEFVMAGGYLEKAYWTTDGWNWVEYREAKHPPFWVCSKGCKSGCGGDLNGSSHCHWRVSQERGKVNGQGDEKSGIGELEFGYRLMFDVVELPSDLPVEVNYHEAKAFCSWKGPGYRLPSEAEHNVMHGPQKSPSSGTSCDIIYQDEIKSNLNMQYGSSTPVNMYPPSSLGFHDLSGNVWEWMEDHFNGFPCYTTHYLYDDFSSPTFDGRHHVIMGGSWSSTGDEASRFARYAFRGHFVQHCGFRLAMTAATNSTSVQTTIRLIENKAFVAGQQNQDNCDKLANGLELPVKVPSTNSQYKYEMEEYLQKILEKEYGYRECEVQSFVEKIMNEANIAKKRSRSVLHLGAGVGRITFELGKHFDEVLGVDFCGRYIDTCLTLQKNKSLFYMLTSNSNGTKKSKMQTTALDGLDMEKFTFKQLTWLPMEIPKHDVVLCTFFDRVQNVRAWIARLNEVLSKNGVLVIMENCGPNLEPFLVNDFTLCKRIDNSNNGTLDSLLTVWKLK